MISWVAKDLLALSVTQSTSTIDGFSNHSVFEDANGFTEQGLPIYEISRFDCRQPDLVESDIQRVEIQQEQELAFAVNQTEVLVAQRLGSPEQRFVPDNFQIEPGIPEVRLIQVRFQAQVCDAC